VILATIIAIALIILAVLDVKLAVRLFRRARSYGKTETGTLVRIDAWKSTLWAVVLGGFALSVFASGLVAVVSA